MSKSYKDVGLKKLRLESGLWLNTVADALGVTHQTYKNHEYGKREPTFRTMAILSVLFGKDIHEIFDAAVETVLYARDAPLISSEEAARLETLQNPPATGYGPRKARSETEEE